MTRQLIMVQYQNNKDDNDDNNKVIKVGDLPMHVPPCVAPDTNLVDMINLFQTGGAAALGGVVTRRRVVGHMALVCVRPELASQALEQEEAVPEDAGYMGIVTLEDCLEALLQEPIEDEQDAAGRVLPATPADSLDEYEAAMGYRLA